MSRIFLNILILCFLASCGDSGKGGDKPGPEPDPIEDKKHYVGSIAEFNALGNLGPGDTVVWRKGNYAGQVIDVTYSGNASKAFVLMGESGKTVFTGASRINVKGSYVVLKGLYFKDPVSTKNNAVLTLASSSSNCRITECAITGDNTSEDTQTDYKWVSLYGVGHKVDKCTFINKKNIGTMLVVWMNATQVPRHTITENYFSRPISLYNEGKQMNGQETIRIGTSDYSLQDALCVVENNWFYRCDGETEAISNKSCANVYKNNLFEECQGTLTLRHGNGCRVEGNYFMGNSVSNTGGIRVIGENHSIVGNYLEKLRGSGYKTGICLVRGGQNPALSGYAQVKNCVVKENTLVDCRYALHINYASNTSTQVMPVISTTIENNVVSTGSSSDYTVYYYTSPTADISWEGNIIYGGKQQGTSLTTVTQQPQLPAVSAAVNNIKNNSGVTWFLR